MKANKTHRIRADEGGSMMVVEAILAATLMLTALLFVTSVQRPTLSRESTGLDMNSLALDILDGLQARTFKDPAGGDPLAMEEWVARILEGDEEVEETVHNHLKEVLGPGKRYLIRLETGHGEHVLLPPGESPTPRGGGAGQTFIFPNWTVHQDETENATTIVGPGEALDFSGWSDLVSPLNTTTGPDGTVWATWWAANDPVGVPASGHVPENILFGTWQYDDGGLCPCYVHIARPDAEANDHPVYGIQMVVWLGA